MKLITAIIKPFKLEDVKDALEGKGITTMAPIAKIAGKMP